MPSELTARFRERGYVALEGFLNSGEVDELRGEIARYVAAVAPSAPSSDVFFEVKGDSATLKQLVRMHEHDPWFAALLTAGRFPALAAELLGAPAVPKNLQYFNKPPGVSTPTPPHQDGFYFMLTPNEALTMWLALDDVDESNGCVRYVAGSHLGGVRPHGKTGVLGFSQGILDYSEGDREREAAIAARPGDLLVHHSLTIHRAEANASDRPRRALGLIYYSVDAKVDEEGHAAYQRAIREEWSKQGRI